MALTKYNQDFGDKKVTFTISHCSYHKKYTLSCLDIKDSERFIKKLKHIEQLTWHQFGNYTRDVGVTPEIENSESFNLIYEQDDRPDKDIEKYYFHFRIEASGTFRVFGFQNKEKFCITHLDAKGSLHH